MLTVTEIMRGKAASSGHPLPSPSLQAAVLLAVLLLHLGLMVSPLHQQMSANDEMAAGLQLMAPPGVGMVQLARTDHGEHVGHCLIRWVNDAQRIGLAGLVAVVLAVAMSGLSRLIATLRPVARALGPPTAGDPQALLQVFRL